MRWSVGHSVQDDVLQWVTECDVISAGDVSGLRPAERPWPAVSKSSFSLTTETVGVDFSFSLTCYNFVYKMHVWWWLSQECWLLRWVTGRTVSCRVHLGLLCGFGQYMLRFQTESLWASAPSWPRHTVLWQQGRHTVVSDCESPERPQVGSLQDEGSEEN